MDILIGPWYNRSYSLKDWTLQYGKEEEPTQRIAQTPFKEETRWQQPEEREYRPKRTCHIASKEAHTALFL